MGVTYWLDGLILALVGTAALYSYRQHRRIKSSATLDATGTADRTAFRRRRTEQAHLDDMARRNVPHGGVGGPGVG